MAEHDPLAEPAAAEREKAPGSGQREPATRGLPLAAALLAACLAVPTFPLWTGRAVPLWDAYTYYFPAFSLLADAVREGRLLLWNLWLSGGRPELADPQNGALSPVVLLAGLLFGGSPQGFVAYWLAIWLATGLGMVVLARHLGAPLWGALIVGAGLLGSGFAVGHAQHTSFLATFAYFPWVLWRLDVALCGRRPLAAAQAGLLCGLSALGGYPAVVFMLLLLATAWVAGRLAFDGIGEAPTARRPRPRDLAVLGVVAAAVGLAIVAPTYLAYALEGRDFSDRTEPLSRERVVFEGSSHPASWMTVAAPRLAIVRTRGATIWGLYARHMGSIYLGAATALLALLALVNEPRSAFRWWLAFLVLCFLALAAGPLLPLRGWLYDLLPPSRYFRHNMVFRAAALIGIAVLAALAARDRNERRADQWDRRLMLLSLGLTPVIGLLLFLVRRSAPQFWHVLPRAHAVANVLAWLVPALVVFACVRLDRRRLVPTLLAACALIEASAGLWACRSILYHQRAVEHVAQIEQQRRGHPPGASFDQTPRGLQRSVDSAFQGLNNHDAIQRVAVLRSLDPLSAQLLARTFAALPLAATATGEQRTFFAPAVAVAEADAKTLEHLARQFDMAGAPVLVVHPAAGQPPPAPALPLDQLPFATRVPIELRAYLPEKLHFDVDAPADGWLLVTDRYTQGWRAQVDGQATPVWKANLFFRAIQIPAGRHEILFAYHPPGHPWLLILSWSTFAAILGLTVFELRRRRMRPPMEA
jgi:hypothetical protein